MTIARGSRPFARLKMSANAPFTDGVSRLIPFDTIDGITDSFGELTFTGLPPVGFNEVFVCQYGFYLVQLQLQVNTAPTTMVAALASVSGSSGDTSVVRAVSGYNSIVTSLNANRKSTETPLASTPPKFPTAIYCQLLMSGGGSGNIIASGTQMLIQQLSTY